MRLPAKLAIALLAIIAFLAAILIFIIATLDLNDYKEVITDEFQRGTGRSLAIKGDISHTLYPWLGIEAGGIVIGNAEGFGDTPFLSTGPLKVRAKLIPLLRNKLEVDALQIKSARLNLHRNEDGIANWDDLAGPDKPDEAPQEPQNKGSSMPVAALLLGGVDIQDAAISWTDNTSGLMASVSRINVRTGALVVGQPIELLASMQLTINQPDIESAINLSGVIVHDGGGRQFSVSPLSIEADLTGKSIPPEQGKGSLTTSIAVDLEQGTAALSDIDFNALSSTVSGSLQINKLDTPAPSLSMKLNIAGEDISAPFKAVEFEPLASQLGKLSDRGFLIETEIDADMSRGDIDIASLEADLLGANIQMEIHARDSFSGTPAATARINAAGPDFPTLIRVAGAFDSRLEKVAGKMKEIRDKSFYIKTDFDADLKNGQINIETFDIKAADSMVNAHLKTGPSAASMLAGQLNAAGADLPMLMALAGAFLEKDNAFSAYAEKLAKLAKKSFALESRFDIDVNAGKFKLPALKADALGFQLTGNDINSLNGSLNGQLSLIAPSLKPVLTALDQPDLAQVLESFTLGAGLAGSLEQPALKDLALDAVLSGRQIPDSPLAVKVRADASLDVKAQDLNVGQFSVSGAGLDIQGKLAVKQYLDNPAFNGALSVEPFNLKKFMRRIGQTPPETADPEVLNRVALANTAFAGTGKELEIKQFNAMLDDSHVQGGFNIHDFNEAGYRFNVEIDRIDADRYLPPGAEDKPAAAETATTSGASDELPLETLRSLDISGDILVGELVISKAKLEDVRLSMNAKNGHIKLAPIAMKLYDGSYNGAITLDAGGSEPLLNIDTDFANVNVGPLLHDLVGAANLQGIGNISLALHSKGGDADTLKNNLSGNGKINFRNGVLQGVDIPGVLRQIEVLYESKRIGRVDKGEETHFDALGAGLNIQNGVISNDDLLMMAPGFAVKGSGILLNLHDQTWKYKFIVDVDETTATQGEKHYNLGGYSLGINCSGKLADKKCLPDVKSVLQALLKDVLKDEIKDLIGDKLLPGLLGKEPPEEQKTESAEPDDRDRTQPADLGKEAVKKLLDKIF